MRQLPAYEIAQPWRLALRVAGHTERRIVRSGFIHFIDDQRTVSGNDISHQPVTARFILARDYRNLVNVGMLRQHGFYFARFHAVASNLDLAIDAIHKFQASILASAYQISASIQARGPILKRIHNEFLCGKLFAAEISAAYTISTDVQFTRHPDRHRLRRRIQHQGEHVGNGASDGDDATIRGVHFMHERPDCGFGRTVDVPQRRTAS